MAVEIGEQLIIGEEGNEQTFEVLYTCEFNEKQYLVVALSEDLDNEEIDPDITAFSYTEDEDETIYFDDVETEEEWKQIESMFMQYLEEAESEEVSE